MSQTAELTSLLEQFNSTQTEIRATLEKQRDEVRKNGESTEATGRRVDELGNRMTAIADDIKAVQARIETAETEIARVGIGGGGEDRPQSLGERFTESEEYQAMVSANLLRSGRVDVGGFFGPSALDTSTGGAAVAPDRRPGIVAAPDRGLRIRDLLNVQTTDSNLIQYVQETGFTNAAAPQVEGQQKEQSSLEYEILDSQVKTIAHWLPATRQIIQDAPQLRARIDNRLIYGLKVKEEGQILYGPGTGENLQGIATHPNVQTYAWSSGQVGDTKIDAIRRAMTLARVAEYPVTGIVLHPTDWEDIELQKGTDGRYIWVEVPVGGVMRLWRVPVVDTTAINEGESVLGAWGLAATLWDRMQSTIYVSDSHADFFTANKVAILAEERLALTIERPEGFVVVDLDNAPAAP